jgi:hypothetical protein
VYWNGDVLYITAGVRVAQWVRSLDVTTHTSLSPILDISCISHFYRFTVMDTSFYASENDFICEDCGKCLKSRSGLRRHRLRKHLKQEIKFKCNFLHKNIFVKRNSYCYLNKFYEINSLYLYYQFSNNYNYSHLIQRKMW